MNRTKIEWVCNPDGTQGYTWSPITGCLNSCSYCYARKLAYGRLHNRYLDESGVLAPIYADDISSQVDPFYPRFWPERLSDKGLGMCESAHKKRGIFVCNMGELFGDWIPYEWQRQIFEVIRANPWHRFYLLTKQPQNIAKFSPFPDNCWVGATAIGDFTSTSDAIGYLHSVKAKVKYISFEPLLYKNVITNLAPTIKKAGIKWLIIGSQTKPYNPPKIEWVQEIVEAADKAGVPVFLKNNLLPLIGELTINDKWVWAKNLGYGGLQRQEMPNT